jgi:hypothetical protein
MTELFTMIVLAVNATLAAIFTQSFKEPAVVRILARNQRREASRDAGESSAAYRPWPML